MARLTDGDQLITDVFADVLQRDGRYLYRGLDWYVVTYVCGHTRSISGVDFVNLPSEREFKRYLESYLKCDKPECNQLTGEDAYWHACTGTPIAD